MARLNNFSLLVWSLDVCEGLSERSYYAKLLFCICNGPVVQLQQIGELGIIEFGDALRDILLKTERIILVIIQNRMNSIMRSTGVGKVPQFVMDVAEDHG